jgi:fructose-1,6-bisphosphatase/inositol monophosphatase family enzyme
MTPTLEEVGFIEKVLRDCGSMLLDCRAAGRTQGEWSGSQFKAEADNLAHNFLVAGLGSLYPDIPFVSEEDDVSARLFVGDHFMIDPIDGTASFAQGFAGWVTQVAYISDGRPVMAAIYAPVSDEFFSAIRGAGAFCNGRQLCAQESRTEAQSLIDNYPEPRGIALELSRALHISRYVESGSIALKICRIADLSADILVKDMSPRDWDVAAPMLVMEELGGVVTDIEGKKLQLGRGGRRHNGLVAAANASIANQAHAWLASRK